MKVIILAIFLISISQITAEVNKNNTIPAGTYIIFSNLTDMCLGLAEESQAYNVPITQGSYLGENGQKLVIANTKGGVDQVIMTLHKKAMTVTTDKDRPTVVQTYSA